MMQPAQMAVVWMMADQQEAAKRKTAQSKPRRSFAGRFAGVGAKLRRFAYRGQLGPVVGNAAA